MSSSTQRTAHTFSLKTTYLADRAAQWLHGDTRPAAIDTQALILAKFTKKVACSQHRARSGSLSHIVVATSHTSFAGEQEYLRTHCPAAHKNVSQAVTEEISCELLQDAGARLFGHPCIRTRTGTDAPTKHHTCCPAPSTHMAPSGAPPDPPPPTDSLSDIESPPLKRLQMP